jgi:hypothetical protein
MVHAVRAAPLKARLPVTETASTSNPITITVVNATSNALTARPA